MNKTHIDRIKSEARDVAAQAHHEDHVSLGPAPAEEVWDAYHKAMREVLGTIRDWSDRIGQSASMTALDLAIEAASARTGEDSIEAPYRAIALVRLLLDDQEAQADGFMRSEPEPTRLTITSAHYTA